MRRTFIVGTIAALIAVILISGSTYLEMRYMQIGAFMRGWAEKGAPDPSFGDPLVVMRRWLLINSFVVFATLSVCIGIFVGSLIRRRSLLPLIVGVAPLIVIQSPSDLTSVASSLLCIVCALGGARVAHVMKGKRAVPDGTRPVSPA